MFNFTGQTSIEYLTTYGWMVVAVSIAGATMYSQVDVTDGCTLGTSGFSPPFPTVSETYQYDNGTVFFEITNPEEDPITLRGLTVANGDQVRGDIGLSSEIPGEASTGIMTNRFSTSENCNQRSLSINYESQSLEGLVTNGTLQGRISIVPLVALFDANRTSVNTGDSIEFNASETESENPIANYTWKFGDGDTGTGEEVTHSYSKGGVYIVELTVEDSQGITDTYRDRVYVGGVLELGGGTVPRLGVQNSLVTECIGPNCENVSTQNQEPVMSGGTEMEGTLFTETLLMPGPKLCITNEVSLGTDEGCSFYSQDSGEAVSQANYQVNGTLETPSVRPREDYICVGDNC